MRVFLPAMALAACLAIPAYAQEAPIADLYGPSNPSNPWEFVLSGSGSNDKDFDNGGFNANAELGYYFTPAVMLGVRQSVGYFDVDGSSAWAGSTTGALDYHFNFNRLRPFIGGNLGVRYGDDVDTSFITGPEIGVKYYVKHDTFIYARGAYEFAFRNFKKAHDAVDDGRFVWVLGLGFNF